MTARFDDGKDSGALRTIGELAHALGLKPHVLRYWEQQFPQLLPLKRSGGRRYYRPGDVALVEEIDRLVNHQGYTLKGAIKALSAQAESSAPLAGDPARDGGLDAFFGRSPATGGGSGEPRAARASPTELVGRLKALRARLAGALEVKDVMPPPDVDTMVAAIERACAHLASLGFASASDMNVGMTAGMAEIEAYRAAHREGRLMLRLWNVLAGNPEGIAQAAWEAGLRPMEGDELLRWGAVKVFADGSAGGLTAAFFDPYLAAAGGGTGVFTFPDETIHALLKLYHEQGWQLDIHAIGDAAIEQVLRGMEAADTPAHPFAGRRHRIEHCGFVTPDQRRRMRARGILPVPQPVFLYEFGDLYIRNLGRERSDHAYPMRSWLEEGAHPAASSDCPVSTVDPFVNLFTMLTRRTNRGTLMGAEETLTIEQAIHCQTWCGAYTQFAEDRRGTLEPGMLADVTILSKDIFAATPEDIRDATQADLTLRDGVPVFDRHQVLT
ncbi:amidohydrolase family protein [Leptolyngbya sp. 15MV]|nr:amidohydrolase family protein [Leptolyngbya sp. 15MV]